MSDKKLEIRDRTIFDGFVARYIFKFIYFIWFKLTGWRKSPSVPEGAGITIAAPHTSNWDIIFALGAAILSNVKIYFSINSLKVSYTFSCAFMLLGISLKGSTSNKLS